MSILAGETVQFTASVLDGNGAVMHGEVITLGVSPSTAGTISTSGLFTSAGPAGAATITATSGTLTTAATVTIAAGPPSRLSKVSGDGQTAPVGTALPDSLRVVVTDNYGNPISLVLVSWAVVSGGAAVTPATSQTLADGISKSRVMLGTQAGPVSVSASFGSVTALFSANGAAGAPVRLALVTAPSSTAANRAAFAVQPVLQLEDANGNPSRQSGVAVTVSIDPFTNVTLGGTTTVTTNSAGTASFTDLSIAGAARNYRLNFTAGSLPVQGANVTVVAGPAAGIAIYSGNDQLAAPGTAVKTPPSAQVVDADGNGVSGVSVTFAVGSGGGSVTGSPAITNAQGIATVGSWTVGLASETSTMTASAAGLAGSPVTFTARVGVPFARFSLSGGGGHTCALSAAGVAYCWGDNRFGQLGDGTLTNRSSPVVARAGTTFKNLYAGVNQTCGITSDDRAECWGKDMAVLSSGSMTFRTLGGGGDGHVCGFASDSFTYCWGSNTFGQLGDGTTTFRPTPVRVLPLPGGSTRGPVNLSLGPASTCGTTDAFRNEALFCWGNNEDGQLGDGTNTNRSAPVLVTNVGPRFIGPAAGARHTCVRGQAGEVFCWGNNQTGQLGDGTTANRSRPASNVTSNNGFFVYQLAAGGSHSCVHGVNVGGTQSTQCWGSNESGQLGDGTETMRSSPVTVSGGFLFGHLVLGTSHSCGLATDGTAYCWGYNGAGALGNGTTTNSRTPVRVRSP